MWDVPGGHVENFERPEQCIVREMKEEMNLILDDFELFSDYYNVNKYGHWEHGNYILTRKDGDEKIAKRHSIKLPDLQEKVKGWKQILLKERSKRIRPGLDDKILA